MKTIKHKYRFFDQDVEVVSNNEETLGLMDSMYRRFRGDVGEKIKQSALYEVLTSAPPDNKPVIRIERRSYTVEKAAYLPYIAHGIILRKTLSRIRSHLLFHAAALSYNDKGIILVADSGCGKTTLALSLVRHGFKFLSDEIAALSLSNGMLVPYPRCLWIRSGTAKAFHQIGWNYPDHNRVKRLGDREAIHLSSQYMGNACRLNYLIIVKTPSNSNDRPCYVTVDRLEDAILTKLQTTIGIDEVISSGSELYRRKECDLFPTLKVRTALLKRVQDICERHEVLVLGMEEEDVEPAFYDNSPEIRKNSRLTGSVELLRSFCGGYRSVLIQEDFGGSPAGLLWPLSRIMKDTKCYQLTSGRLDKMVEVICNVLG